MAKNFNLVTIFFIFIGLIFIGCSSEETQNNPYRPTVTISQEVELIIGIHPYFNTQKMFLAYAPLLSYLQSHLTGVHFKMETSLDYADFERKLKEKRFNVALPNPYQTLKAVDSGYEIVAKVKPDSGFRGLIIARKDQHIRSVEQLRGQSIAFPAATALAAAMMPKLFLLERGVNVEKEAYPRYVGSQYSSIMNAYSGNTFAACTWPASWNLWKAENPQKAKEMEILWETPSLVSNSIVVRADFDDKVKKRLVELLIQLDRNPQMKVLLKNIEVEGFEKADDNTYDSVRKFLRHYDDVIGLPK